MLSGKSGRLRDEDGAANEGENANRREDVFPGADSDQHHSLPAAVIGRIIAFLELRAPPIQGFLAVPSFELSQTPIE
jgi:hypothetical protein